MDRTVLCQLGNHIQRGYASGIYEDDISLLRRKNGFGFGAFEIEEVSGSGSSREFNPHHFSFSAKKLAV